MVGETVVVHQIFLSIQGESSFAGMPCAFVRLSGCNLNCRWCDTPEAFEPGTRMSVEEILQRVTEMGTPLVEVTGGEPLLQDAVRPLLEALCDTGKTVLLETSGERDISSVDPRVRRIMDIKTPSSGESERVRWRNIEHLTATDEVKFVIHDRGDYEWARGVLMREGLVEKAAEILMSPVHGRMEPRQLVAWVLEDRLPVRVQLQLHKFIWHPDERGV